MPAETHMEKAPLDRTQVLDLIRDLLADILEIEPAATRSRRRSPRTSMPIRWR